MPFELQRVGDLPSDHELRIRIDGTSLEPGDDPLEVGPSAAWEVCLETGDRAPISTSTAEEWLELRVQIDGQAVQTVPIQLSWQVDGLTPWERWQGLVYLLLGLSALAFMVYGYIRPSRFPRGLAIILCTEEDMEEGARYGVSQHKGTGVGFYRDARVCIASDYRIMGDSRLSRARGAVVRLRANGRLVAIQPMGGHTIERQNVDEDWDPIPGDRESTVRFGQVYRLAGHGELYFEVRRG